MAKISANGAHEVARFRHRSGWTVLVRSDGAILFKSHVPGSRWTLTRKATVEAALAEYRGHADYQEVRR